MPAFEMRELRAGERVRFDLEGELDDAAAGSLRAIDLDGLADTGYRVIALNLEKLVFVDSSGIGSLVHLRNRAVSRGFVFEIRSLDMNVERTLVMAGLAELFDLNPNA